MNLLNGLVLLSLLLIATAEGNSLRRKQNSPLATLQRLSPSIFGRSELDGEEMETTTEETLVTIKPVTESTTESTTKKPRKEDNLGIAKFLDSLNFDHVDKAIDNLNIPEFKM